MNTGLLPFGTHTVGSLLAEHAADRPDSVFLVYEDETGAHVHVCGHARARASWCGRPRRSGHRSR